jgi:RNA polymerase sigma factor for flagellar operon FliA
MAEDSGAMSGADHELFSTPPNGVAAGEPVVPELVEQELVERAFPLLEQVARTLAWQLNHRVDVDDLRSAGHLALTDLVRRFEQGRAPFEAYMRARLRWAMIDELRKSSRYRVLRAQVAALAAADEMADSRVDSSASSPAAMPPSEGAHLGRLKAILREHATVLGLSLMVERGRDIATAPSSAQPERAALRAAGVEALHRAVAELGDERLRMVIERHYFEGKPLADVARELGLSKAWTSRLHAQAIRALERRLRGTNADPRSRPG